MAVNIALCLPEGVALRRRYEVSLQACLGAAQIDGDTADAATGRNIQTSHRTGATRMARLLGLVRSARTFRKARAVFRALGIQKVVDEGRYLTKTERLMASLQRDPNSRRPAQIRKASTRVFTMDKKLVEMIGHLPRRGSTTPKLTLRSTHQKRARARSAALNAGLPLQRLAGKLMNEATFLRGTGTRAICQALQQAGIDPEMWTAHDVATAMYADVQEKRWTAPEQITNPVGYLRFLLSTINVAAHVERKRKARALRDARLATARAAVPPTRSAEQQAVNARGAALVRKVLLGDTQIDNEKMGVDNASAIH